jgi:RNA polymerase sigma-70 factor (ECF subfamily)
VLRVTNEAISEHMGPVLRWLRQRSPDDATADDLLQEVLVRAYTKRDQLNDQAAMAGWLRRIAYSVWVDAHRRTKPTVPLDVDVAVEDAVPDDLTAAVAQMAEHFVRALPEPYRTAVVLSDQQGVSQAELARRLGMSASGVRSRVQRGRAMAKDALLGCCAIAWETGQVASCTPRTTCDCS